MAQQLFSATAVNVRDYLENYCGGVNLLVPWGNLSMKRAYIENSCGGALSLLSMPAVTWNTLVAGWICLAPPFLLPPLGPPMSLTSSDVVLI